MAASRLHRRLAVAATLLTLGAAAALASPAEAAVTVTIDSGPANPSGDSSATFAFHAAGANGSVSYACALDAAGLTSCTSPQTYTGIRNGDHSFTVRATDAAGASDTKQYRWTVADSTPPETTIVSGPADSTTSPDATLEFSSSEPSSTFACSLDGGASMGCTSPQSYVGLAPGQHTFAVTATDGNGNTDSTPATRSWTIAGAGGPPAAAHVVDSHAAALRFHGPYPYSGPRFLRMLAHPKPVRNPGPEFPDEEPTAPEPPCGSPCTTPVAGEPLGPAAPPPPSNRWKPQLGAFDMNIAAGDSSYLVLVADKYVAFYDKGGNLLTTGTNAVKKITDPIPSATFFAPVLKKLNNAKTLNLPPPYDAKLTDGTLKYKLDDVYDMRVLWDSYRKRFWVVAQARNSVAKNGTDEEKLKRRDKIVAAFSKDADPRDGWTYWSWDAEAGDGSCNSQTLVKTPPAGCYGDYLPGDGADYFTIGISEHALTETEYVGDEEVPNHNWDEINVMRADQMVAGTCQQQCGWAYGQIAPPDGSGGTMTGTTPAQQHGPSTDDRQYIVGANGAATLDVFSFQPAQTTPWPPPLTGQAIGVNGFQRSIPIGQPVAPNGENATPATVNLGKNLAGNKIMRAVYRDDQLYALKPDCRVWGGQSACTPSIHF
ncbi:MAG: large repetitive protein, partial [Thermoleophilaceae bacterium]|nr:large repetitive protein [Thermoleophilaceae bacterium]